MEAILGSHVIKEGKQVEVSSFSGQGKVVGLYFSAHWCPPCRNFTPKLVEYYNEAKAGPAGDKFEIVFISFDRDEASYNDYFGTMPWCSLDFHADNKQQLGTDFQVNGIPALIFLDASNGNVKTSDGRNLVTRGESIQNIIDM